jgi:type IV pilus modification protein PilV
MKANTGFSLIEVMCSILILGVGLAGLTQGISTALTSSKESELQTTAALIASSIMETLRADGILKEGTQEGDGSGAFSLYKWKQTITRTQIDGLYEVAVEVDHAKTGKAIYELQTMLFDPPASSLDQQTTSRKDNDTKKKGGRRR